MRDELQEDNVATEIKKYAAPTFGDKRNSEVVANQEQNFPLKSSLKPKTSSVPASKRPTVSNSRSPSHMESYGKSSPVKFSNPNG